MSYCQVTASNSSPTGSLRPFDSFSSGISGQGLDDVSVSITKKTSKYK